MDISPATINSTLTTRPTDSVEKSVASDLRVPDPEDKDKEKDKEEFSE